MKRSARSPAVSTQIRDGLNTVLNPAGLQISTLKAERLEQARLEKLVARGHWGLPQFSEGLALDPVQHLEFLESICEPYREQLLTLPVTDPGTEQFYRNNGWFESVDADVLYGVVRKLAPAQVVEIGSGHSSRLTAQAIRDGRLATRLVCVDPCPRVEIRHCADEFIESPVEDLPFNELADRLKPGDVLFIDSSHLIKSGGDVVYLYLQVLPRLRPGVLIHAHDIFLPFEYPQEFVVKKRWGWSEQYLVHALLMNNRNFEILWPSCYMWQMHREALRGMVPAEKADPPPSSLWLRTR
jgi:predicted O-methyltransferase YrrM